MPLKDFDGAAGLAEVRIGDADITERSALAAPVADLPRYLKPPPERQRVRNEHSRPLVAELKMWLQAQRAKLSAHSETAKAIAYCLNRWSGLVRFLDDGRLCVSNNAAERALRCVAVGRHNWTFAGSDEGGRRAVAIYTLVETCKLNSVASFFDTIDPGATVARHKQLVGFLIRLPSKEQRAR